MRLIQTHYDRDPLTVGIVHVGFGAFHRAHQAVYIDEYMQASGDFSCGIAGVNLRAEEAAAFWSAAEAVKTQGGYLLKTTTPDGVATWRRARSHAAFADWSTDAEGAEALLARPETRAVTITVTESGYYLKDDWSLDQGHPVIVEEVSGGVRRSIYAFLAGGLAKRMAAEAGPITILCCDNIRANGRMLEANLDVWLRATGAVALADWIAANASFPCSMVDRITPRAGDALIAEAEAAFGPGNAPIHAEAFHQWVLEDRFAGPMPDLTRIGVQVVADVDPYEEAKIRFVNGGHAALTFLGALAGHTTFDEAMADPRIRPHFDAFTKDEVLPGLTIDLPFDKHEYLAEIAARFCNVAIADQLERICMDGFSKMPIYIRPTVESCLAQGLSIEHGLNSIAAWVVFARRAAAGIPPIPYHEPYWHVLAPLLAVDRVEDLARFSQLWGDLPERYPAFVSGLIAAISAMEAAWPAPTRPGQPAEDAP